MPGAGERTLDPALCFQRLIVIAHFGEIDLKDVTKCELNLFPAASVKAPFIMLEPDKSQLGKFIQEALLEAEKRFTEDERKLAEAQKKMEPDTGQYVLDGGSFLHRLKWKDGETYGGIAESYAKFSDDFYEDAIVVYDGYDETSPTIKDQTHQKRNKGAIITISVKSHNIFGGCDSTSRIFGIGKAKAFQKLLDDLDFCKCADVF